MGNLNCKFPLLLQYGLTEFLELKVCCLADKPTVEKLIDACLANKGNTPQQTAWNYVKCYHEKDPKHAIFL
ncbi:hypothetical protein PYW08_003164 [Mythimna loreyi]|uniref:Uncharacterized protein n=1 Tax=Mythimna loreyi TaxID=667449 RepID=A0ACC2QRE8_9NEOP|nr:hypothetical protein PYW08_003164 [Mythimna loreyi]